MGILAKQLFSTESLHLSLHLIIFFLQVIQSIKCLYIFRMKDRSMVLLDSVDKRCWISHSSLRNGWVGLRNRFWLLSKRNWNFRNSRTKPFIEHKQHALWETSRHSGLQSTSKLSWDGIDWARGVLVDRGTDVWAWADITVVIIAVSFSISACMEVIPSQSSLFSCSRPSIFFLCLPECWKCELTDGWGCQTTFMMDWPFIEKTQCETHTWNYECSMMHDMLNAKIYNFCYRRIC